MSDTCGTIVEKYRRWAAANPSLIQDVEIFLRGFSYFLTGYIKESVVLSEFVYSMAQLISFLHTRLLTRNSDITSSLLNVIEDLLRILKCVEVFLELAALRLGGTKARWLMLLSVQILKACMKLIIFKDTGNIVKPLDDLNLPQHTSKQAPSSGDHSYTLPFSGRRIRTVNGAPPIYQRSWKPPPAATHRLLDVKQLTGEIMYIFKPVLHLAAVGRYGEQAWTPFLMAFSVDASSQLLLGSKDVTREHREEILRRWFSLANYCLRSPFYDKKSKYVILAFLKCIEKCLPFGGGIVASFREYLPEYQKIYHYIWSQD